jgi:hypothetical protein
MHPQGAIFPASMESWLVSNSEVANGTRNRVPFPIVPVKKGEAVPRKLAALIV